MDLPHDMIAKTSGDSPSTWALNWKADLERLAPLPFLGIQFTLSLELQLLLAYIGLKSQNFPPNSPNHTSVDMWPSFWRDLVFWGLGWCEQFLQSCCSSAKQRKLRTQYEGFHWFEALALGGGYGKHLCTTFLWRTATSPKVCRLLEFQGTYTVPKSQRDNHKKCMPCNACVIRCV